MQRLQKNVLTIITAVVLASSTIVYSPVASQTKPDTQKTAIFDLHGVLIRTSGEVQAVGLGNFLYYAMRAWPNPLRLKETIKKSFFGFLHSIQPPNSLQPVALDPDGTPVPQIMVDWLTGAQSTAVILKKIETAALTHSPKIEVPLLLAICRMTFSPEQFIMTQEWVEEGLELAYELKERGYKIYILSNWDPESFELLKEYYPEILSRFDGIMISGNAQSIKPDCTPGNIYEQLLQKYSINPERAVFIDDLEVNVKAAQTRYGIRGIICQQNRMITKPWAKYPDIAQVRRELHAWEFNYGTRLAGV